MVDHMCEPICQSRKVGSHLAAQIARYKVGADFRLRYAVSTREARRRTGRLAHSTSQNCRLLHVSVQKHAVVLLGLGIRAVWGAPDARGIRPNTDAVVSPRRRRHGLSTLALEFDGGRLDRRADAGLPS